MTQIPNVPAMWADGTQLVLSIEAPAGLLYRQSLPEAVLTARLGGGEIVRFTYDLTDPETGEVTHGAARLLLQDMPDPRQASNFDTAVAELKTLHGTAEVQPAAPAEATADACRKCGRTFREDGKFVDSAAQSSGLPYCQTCVGHCHDTEIADHWCEIDGYRTRADKAAPGSHSAPEPPRGA